MIEDASSVTVTIISDGGTAIQKADFDGPLTLSLPGSESILSMRVSSRPSEVAALLRFTAAQDKGDNVRLIQPLLMNPGDTLSLFVLVSGFKGKVMLSGRVIGVPSIRIRQQRTVIEVTMTLFVLSLSSLFLMIWAVLAFVGDRNRHLYLTSSAWPILVGLIASVSGWYATLKTNTTQPK